MPLHDSNPERRNLTVTSIAFIVFYFGGGAFTSSEIRLQVINVSFENTIVLALLAWGGLLWFAYRYWLRYKGKFTSEFHEEMRRCGQKPYLKYYLKRKTGEPLFDEYAESGLSVESLERNGNQYLVNYKQTLNPQKDENGKNVRWETKGKTHTLNIEGVHGYYVKFRMVISCAVKSPSFSDYAVPYILFVVAVGSGLTPLLKPD